jgi:hypothetical protein
MGFINIPGMTWKEPVADVASLPTVGNVEGEARVTLDTGSIYVWDGSTWNASGGGGGGLTIGGAISGGTANRILYESSGNLLAESANLQFSGNQTILGSSTTAYPLNVRQTAAATGAYIQITSADTGHASTDGLKIGYEELVGGSFVIDNQEGSPLRLRSAGNTVAQIIRTSASAHDFVFFSGTNMSTLNNTSYFGYTTYTGAMNPFQYGAFSSGLVVGVTYGIAGQITPNYELDIRGGAGDATIQLSNTLSGTASGNGALVQLTESGGNSLLQLKHQGGINSNYIDLYVGGASAAKFNTGGGSGRMTLGLTEMYGPNAGYNTQALFLKGDLGPDTDNTYYIGAYRSTANVAPYPFKAAYIGSEGVMIGATAALSAGTKPNYELDVRGAAGNATIQLSNTASGSMSSDGALIDFDGTDLKITNQENGKLLVSDGLGVGNSAAATTLGSVTKKIEIFNETGTSLGFIAV